MLIFGHPVVKHQSIVLAVETCSKMVLTLCLKYLMPFVKEHQKFE